jgi:Phytanoyl-CoA dioxygenase (PhyH)
MSESPASPLPTFRDPVLEGQFRRTGVVVVPFLDEVAVAHVRTRALASYPDSTEPFFTSALEGARDEVRTWTRPVIDELQPTIDGLFVDHVVRDVFLTVKRPVGPGEDGGRVPLHQDWTFVDERQTRGVLIWCPLVDVDEQNAALMVVPGSHRLGLGPCGAPPLDDNLGSVADQMRERQVVLSMPRGHAVVYDGAIVHASAPNRGSALRPVLGVGVSHRKATHVTYHQVPGVGPVVFEIEPDYYGSSDLLAPPQSGIRASSPVAQNDLAPLTSLGKDALELLDDALAELVGSGAVLPAADA